MLIGMVSLAGLPFTAGFLGKFYIFYAAVSQRQIALIVAGVITVGCGFYYYLKVVRAMYWQSVDKTDAIPVNGLSRVAISALIVATICLGVYPQPIFDALKRQKAPHRYARCSHCVVPPCRWQRAKRLDPPSLELRRDRRSEAGYNNALSGSTAPRARDGNHDVLFDEHRRAPAATRQLLLFGCCR